MFARKTPAIFRNSIKSYAAIACLGLAAGVITRVTDLFPADTIWNFSSIATLFGFWILTVTLIIFHSCSNINAGINTFLYLAAMSFSFYFLKYILGLFLPQFYNEDFQYSLFWLYTTMSVLCGLIAFFLYFWNNNRIYNSVLYALPVGALFAETLGVGIYLFSHRTFLFQFIFDLLGGIIIGRLFYKKSGGKLLYIVVAVLIAIVGYGVFYRPFL